MAEAAGRFQRLSDSRPPRLVQLARAFGGRDGEGPDRDELLAAATALAPVARHRATRADRKGVIELDTAERLEWLDQYALARPGRAAAVRFAMVAAFAAFRRRGPAAGAPASRGPAFNGRPPFTRAGGPPPPRETPAPPR